MRTFIKKLNSILATVLTIVALLAGQTVWAQSFPTASGGTGTENDPYLIKTTADLDALASDVNSGNSYSGTYFQLDADIEYDPNDLNANGENYTAIGRTVEKNGNFDVDYVFGGHFDGQNHTVRGIRINKTGYDYADRCQGLFGIVANGGTVKNVCVSDAVITGCIEVGGIAGRNHGTIENCHVNATVSVTDNNCQFGIIGGIVGWNNIGTIRGCTSAATVSGYYQIGGIVGLNYSTIMDCSANGANVTATDGKGGAIVGENNCYEGAYNAILSRNYYTNCTLTIGSDSPATTSIGCGHKATEDINSDTYTPTDVTEMIINGVTYNDGAVNYWNWLKNQLANASPDASAPTVITLVCDVVAGSGDSRLEVPIGRHAVIDLNGHKIDRGLNTETSSGEVIAVRNNSSNTNPASLVIRDSQGGGQITGGYTSATGGGITVSGTLTLEGGTICGNRSKNNGGGLSVSGTFIMTGGTITDNTCIPGTYSSGSGSAIYANSGTINLQGGTITNNKGPEAIYANKDMIVSGTYDLSGNTLYDGTTAAPDITLENQVIIISSAISPVHPATVGFATGGPTITSGWSTYMNDADLDDCFMTTANGKGLGIVNGEVTVGTLHTITLADANITANAASAAQGKSITLGYSGELPTGYAPIYSVNGNTISGNTFAMPDEDVTVSASLAMPAIAYIDENGDEQTCSDFTILSDANIPIISDDRGTIGTDGKDTWYVAIGNYTFSHERLYARGHVHLILCDGATFTVIGNMYGIFANSLNIYSQSQGTGSLVASTNHENNALGAIAFNTALTINGGNVSTSTVSGDGINGNGTLTINGGTVEATGNDRGISCDGNITLGWTNANDRITASSYYCEGTISVKEGQALYDGTDTYTGTLTTEQISAIAGKTLQPAMPAVVLADDADNTDAINNFDGQHFDAVVLSGRTLYKDGDWNTLCLPFNLTIAGSVLEGATVKTLISSSFNNGTLTLNFTEDSDNLTAIEAGKPYIIKWDSGSNIVDPVFTGVTVSNTTSNVQTDYVDFKSTYAPITFDAADKSVLFMGSNNTLFYPEAGASIGAFRAYFQLGNGLSAGNLPANGVKMFFGGDNETDGLSPNPSPVREGSAGAWYTLDGRKVSLSPDPSPVGEGRKLPRGVYIHNGKKVIVK